MYAGTVLGFVIRGWGVVLAIRATKSEIPRNANSANDYADNL